jgi:hypothetical protein
MTRRGRNGWAARRVALPRYDRIGRPGRATAPRHPRGGQPITGGYAGLFDPPGGQTCRLLRRRRRGPPRIGARLAQREPAGRSRANEASSFYGPEVAGALKGSRRPARSSPAPEVARIPLNACPVGREDEDRVVRPCGLPSRKHRRAGRRGRLRGVWADASRHVGAYHRCRRTVPRRRSRRRRAGDGDDRARRAACSTCSTRTRGIVHHLWRTWVARDTDLARRRPGRRREHATTRSSRRPVTGGCRAPFASDARLAVRPGEQPRPGPTTLDQRAIATAAGASGLTTPTTLRTVREPGRLRQREARRRPPSSRRSALRRAAAARPDESDPPRPAGLWGRRPTRSSASARPCWRPVT